MEEGRLFIAPLAGEKRRLVPVTATSFRYEDAPVASVFRVVDHEGDPILQQGQVGNYERVNAVWLYFQRAVAAATLLLLLSAPLFALVWVPARLFGRMKTTPLATVLLPLLATLSIVVSFALPPALSSDPIQDLGTVSGVSLAIFIGSLVFAALTMLSLRHSFGSSSVETGRFVRWHCRLVSLACSIALLYVWAHGLIGLRTWAY